MITGGAGSIGRALMARVEVEGWTAIGLDLPEGLAELDGRYLACDITDEQAVRATFTAIEEEYGDIDVLVNNAGLSLIGAFDEHSAAEHRRVMEVNYFGSLHSARAALPSLRRTRGRIVQMSSVAGFAPVVGRPAYIASKHAVTGVFEALRAELSPSGVGVTLVHPTFVSAPMADAAARSETGDQVTPEEVADAIVDAIVRGRDRVLLGRTAVLAWWVRRLSPALYERLMRRRLG